MIRATALYPTILAVALIAPAAAAPLNPVYRQTIGMGDLHHPRSIAAGEDGIIHVLDDSNYRVVSYDQDGVIQHVWGEFGTGDGYFYNVDAIAVDHSGSYVYALDQGEKRVKKFSSTGTPITGWGSPGTGTGQFNSPTAIALDSQGSVYVAESNGRIQKFTGTGTHLHSWNAPGAAYVAAITVDQQFDVFLCDQGGSRVFKLDSTGTLLHAWNAGGTPDGRLRNPSSIAVDREGDLYVVEEGEYRARKFTADSAWVYTWGGYGSGEGEWEYPRGVAIDPELNIYIVDYDGDNVEQFKQVAVRTFTAGVRTKLFIGPIGIANCDPVGALGVPVTPSDIARQAAYMAFCALTDRSFQENPLDGSSLPPLDARVLSIVNLRWKCQAESSIPVSLGEVTPVGSLGGPEALGLSGIANPIEVRNDILQDGTWSFASSGHPNPVLEPTFQVHRIRFNRDIWHRMAGAITCGTDASGNPTSTITMGFSHATRFPSHRSYWYDISSPVDRFLNIANSVPQQAFSNLWTLPAIAPALVSPADPLLAQESPAAGTCALNPPLPPDPVPPDYDSSPLAADWCSQLAQCGFDTTGCAQAYLESIAHPITEPVLPAANDSTLSSGNDTRFLSCLDSEEFLAGESPCTTVEVNERPPSGQLSFAVAPNPFMGSTMFRITVPYRGRVILVIVDVTGRRVRRLAGDELPAGDHRFHWNGQDDRGQSVAAGVYFAQVWSPSGMRRIRVVALR